MEQQPKIEERGPFTLVGTKITAKVEQLENNNPFGQLWDNFKQMQPNIKHVARLKPWGKVTINMMWAEGESDEDFCFNSLTAYVVAKVDELATGLTVKKVPARKYVVLTHNGPASKAGALVEQIAAEDFATWLAQKGWQLDGDDHWEWFDDRFKGEDAKSVQEILVPVIPV